MTDTEEPPRCVSKDSSNFIKKIASRGDIVVTHELSIKDIPGGLREQYVRGHYREPHRELTWYWGSIIDLHNESLNIWTAIMSVVSISVWFWRHCLERSIFHSPDAWPLTLVAASMLVVHIGSCNAHLYSHASVELSGVFFMFDYFGITLYLYLAAISTYVYSVRISGEELMWLALIVTLFNAVAWPWFASRCLAAYRESQQLSQRPSMSTALFALNCFNSAFILYAALLKVAQLDLRNYSFDQASVWYLLWLIVTTLDLLVYKFHIPESLVTKANGDLSPLDVHDTPKDCGGGGGKADTTFWDYFHSHVIHHLFALASNLCHLEALECDWDSWSAGQSDSSFMSLDYQSTLRNVSLLALITSLSNFSVIFVLIENFLSYIALAKKNV